MTAPLRLADSMFNNAAIFSVRYQILPSCEPVDVLSAETGRWFGKLEDVEGDAVTLKQRLWRLRAAAQLTLLPFNSPDLPFANECREITRLARSYPELAQRSEHLSALVQQLTALKENPKRAAVFELIESHAGRQSEIGLVTVLTRGRVPGWSLGLMQELRSLFPHLELITSKVGLEQSAFDGIILPGGGRLCPILQDLHYSGHAATLDIVAYKSEARAVCQRPSLPNGTLKKESRRQTAQTVQPIDPGLTEFAGDAWVQKRFWESARRGVVVDANEHASAIMIPARLVILANTKKTFLENDSKVIEVSEILIGGRGADQTARKLPRRRVSDLMEGHLIALRTSRSGSYLVSVADALLRGAGKSKLRAEALDWKPRLHEALMAHGSETLAAFLEEKHHSLAHFRYIEVWTTDRVIRPESESLFRDLMLILGKLGFLPDGAGLVALAKLRWHQMRELIHYHHLAGIEIRKALLKELGRIIDSGERVENEMHVTLPGVDAGRLSLYRVTDVDPEIVEVPYTALDVVRDLEE